MSMGGAPRPLGSQVWSHAGTHGVRPIGTPSWGNPPAWGNPRFQSHSPDAPDPSGVAQPVDVTSPQATPARAAVINAILGRPTQPQAAPVGAKTTIGPSLTQPTPAQPGMSYLGGSPDWVRNNPGVVFNPNQPAAPPVANANQPTIQPINTTTVPLRRFR